MSDKIDPNDLSSIDALLDEAELEDMADDQVEEVVAEETESNQATDEVGDSDTEELIEDDLVEVEEELESEPEPEPESEPESEPEPVIDDVADKALEKRAKSHKAKKQKEPTVAEMNEIKKLIIIFSSVLITLAVIGVAVGMWAALSSGGLDDASLEKVDNIESGVTESLLNTNASNKTIKELEKKVDGLSYLIKQLDQDLLAISSKATSQTEKSLLNLAASHQGANATKEVKKVEHEQQKKAEEKTVSQVTNVSDQSKNTVLNSNITKKIDKVSAQMSNAQRRIYEVNKRIKSLQSQHKKLLRSIKSVEKQMLEKQLKTASVKKKSVEKAETSKDTEDESEPTGLYQYTAPGGMFENNSDYYR